MSRCHDRPNRFELPGTGAPQSLGSRGSGSSGAPAPNRRPLVLQPEDFVSGATSRGPSDLASRMAAWADGVVERLQAFGLVGLDATACEVSDDSHRVRFAIAGRIEGDATCLLLGVDPAGVRAGLELPAAQAREARMR